MRLRFFKGANHEKDSDDRRPSSPFTFASATMALGYLSVHSSPVRVRSLYSPIVDPRGHPIAVQFYFMQPLRPGRGFLHRLGKLRWNEAGKWCVALARRTGLGGLRSRTLYDPRHGANLSSNWDFGHLTRVCHNRLSDCRQRRQPLEMTRHEMLRAEGARLCEGSGGVLRAVGAPELQPSQAAR